MRGLSLLEFAVVVTIIAILLVTAMSRLIALQVDVERVKMQTDLANLRSAIGMEVATKMVRQKMGALRDLDGSNPMNLLARRPGNYLGELDDPDPARLEDGNWYFDTRSRQLVYLVRHEAFFTGGARDPVRARFVVQLVYADRNGNGAYDPGADRIEGLRLMPVESYAWTN